MSAPDPPSGALPLVRPHAPRLLAVVVLQAVGAVAGLLPLLAVVELGRILLGGDPVDRGRVALVIGVGALGLLARLLFTGASSALGHLLDGHVQLALRRGLAARLARVPLGWLAGRRTGELSTVVGEGVSAVHPFIAHVPAMAVSAVVVPVVSSVYLFSVDWRLTLITLVPVLGALALLPLIMAGPRQREQAEFDAGMGRIADSAVEFVQGIAVVKTFGGGDRAHARFRAAVDEFVHAFTRMVRGLAAPAAGMQLLLSPPVVLFTISAGGTGLVLAGSLDPVDVVAFLLLGLGLTAPLSALLGHSLDDVQAATRALGRIHDLLTVPVRSEPTDPRNPRGHRVRFHGVEFAHEPGQPVLRDLDLDLAPGTVTALVGPSGSGKSTLAQLLARFLDPTAGVITLGGVDLRAVDTAEVARTVSFVFQDVRLLRASVADNIALAVPHADRSAVQRAAEIAGVHERILELPRGYDAIVGEDTVLSGGEAQRIAVARAVLADAPVLVLDEATSFADPQTERAVRRTLRSGRADRTLLVVAHRWETVADADHVVMLDGGTVVECGRPDDLLARDGRFAAFWAHAHRGVPT